MGFRMKNNIICVLLCMICLALLVGCNKEPEKLLKKSFVFGKDIKEEDFNEFYYTYSKTVNPPEFQRYRFYVEDGKHMFYHEKREGDSVFLTEEDITISGSVEMSDDEWKTFCDYLESGTVVKRSESTASGGGGPWMYLYWEGDRGELQEFSFDDYEMLISFEEFCVGLVP